MRTISTTFCLTWAIRRIPSPWRCWRGIPGRSPNLGGTSASVISPSFNNLTSLIAKIDHNFNANNTLTGRYFFGDSVQSFPLALTATGGPVARIQYLHSDARAVRFALLRAYVRREQDQRTRYGWNRFAEGFFPADQNFHPSSIGLCASYDSSIVSWQRPFDSGLADYSLVSDSRSWGERAALLATALTATANSSTTSRGS